MKFTKYDLGVRKAGEVAIVTLSGNRAHVRLMTSGEFQNYRAGRRFTSYGGVATGSPVRLEVPHGGTWVVVVDLDGLGGSVRSGVSMAA